MPPAVVPPVTGAPAPSNSPPVTGAILAPHAVAGITLAGSASLVLLVLLARKLGRSCCWHTSRRPPPRTPNPAAALLSPQIQSPGAESECSRECATCAFRIARWDAVRHAAQAAGVADVDAYYAGTVTTDSESASGSESGATELTVPTPDWGSENGECQQLQWASTPELDESFRFYADMFAEYAGAGSSEEFEFRLEESKRESRPS